MKQFVVTVTLPLDRGNRGGLATILTPSGVVERREIFAPNIDEASKPGWAASLISRMYPAAGAIHGDNLFESVALNGGLVSIWIVDVEGDPPVYQCGTVHPSGKTVTPCIRKRGHELDRGTRAAWHRDNANVEWLD